MAQPWSEQVAGPNIRSRGDGETWMFGAGLGTDDVRRARKVLNIAGIVALIIGFVAIVVPAVASVATAIFVGWVLVAAGITMGARAFSNRAWLRGLEALLTLIAGLYLLLFPLSGTVSLTFVLAVWFFASGFLSLSVAAREPRSSEQWMTALGGVLSVVLGFLIAVNLPSSASWAIGLLLGIHLIFWGIRALVGAQVLKQLFET
jgi:uncharacterized membrane protein HdeD (DUF308 family)